MYHLEDTEDRPQSYFVSLCGAIGNVLMGLGYLEEVCLVEHSYSWKWSCNFVKLIVLPTLSASYYSQVQLETLATT